MREGTAVDDDTETSEGTEESAPTNAELDAKVNALDSKLDMILGKLSGTKDDAHTAAAEHTEDRLNRPSNIADEIRQQLDEQRARDAASAREQADSEWRKGVDEQLAGMAEKTPEAPLRRVEKIMGWR